MKRNVAVAFLLFTAAPVHAEWSGLVYEHGSVRQVILAGIAEANQLQRITLLCTDTADTEPSYRVMVSLPATGEYSVRQADPANLSIALGERSWSIEVQVEANSSAEFLAAANWRGAKDIVAALEAAPSEMAASITVGPISEKFVIEADLLYRQAKEWLDGCGRT